MSEKIHNLYKLQKRDIPLTGPILADAFKSDPVWNKIYENEIYP